MPSSKKSSARRHKNVLVNWIVEAFRRRQQFSVHTTLSSSSFWISLGVVAALVVSIWTLASDMANISAPICTQQCRYHVECDNRCGYALNDMIEKVFGSRCYGALAYVPPPWMKTLFAPMATECPACLRQLVDEMIDSNCCNSRWTSHVCQPLLSLWDPDQMRIVVKIPGADK